MKVLQLFILVLAFFIIKPASAGLLVEPVVGFSGTKFKSDITGASEEKGSGVSYGGRLGYQNFGLQLGIDYLGSNINVSDSDYSALKTSEWAGFVGFEFPVLFRVYAGYIFSANAETKYTSAGTKQDLKLSDGSGMKVGLGFTGLPFIDINFEYRKGTFGEYKLGSTAKQTIDTDYSAYMISLSLPLVF